MSAKYAAQDLTGRNPLARRIAGAAYNLAFEYGAEAEDIQSEMVLAILERYGTEPQFLEQTDAYIVNFGAWRARNVLNRECRSYYNQTVDGDAYLEGEDGDTVLDLLSDAGSWDEVEFSFDIRTAVEALEPRDQQICSMIGGGWRVSEIASEIDVARRTVYYRLSHPIRQAVSAQLSVPDCTN